MPSMFGANGIGGWLMMIIWGLLPIFLLIYLFQLISGREHRVESRQSEGAMEILRRRYARGEITSQQFEEMKRDLE